jgi:hypothetical protein
VYVIDPERPSALFIEAPKLSSNSNESFKVPVPSNSASIEAKLVVGAFNDKDSVNVPVEVTSKVCSAKTSPEVRPGGNKSTLNTSELCCTVQSKLPPSVALMLVRVPRLGLNWLNAFVFGLISVPETFWIEAVSVSGRVAALAETGRHAVASNAIAPQRPERNLAMVNPPE